MPNNKGYKLGDGAAQPLPLTVFKAKDGRVGVRIGSQRPYKTVDEVSLSGVPSVLITTDEKGELIVHSTGVVKVKKGTAAVTS